MFDIGFWELVLIAIIGLLVAGPERLPGFAREAGRWVRRIRNMTSEARRELERELDWNDDDSDNSVAGLKRRLSDVERELTGDDEDNDNGVSGLKRRLKEMDRMMKEKPDHQSGKKRNIPALFHPLQNNAKPRSMSEIQIQIPDIKSDYSGLFYILIRTR